MQKPTCAANLKASRTTLCSDCPIRFMETPLLTSLALSCSFAVSSEQVSRLSSAQLLYQLELVLGFHLACKHPTVPVSIDLASVLLLLAPGKLSWQLLV